MAGRTPAERTGDWFGRFIGSLGFIATHVAVFAAWAVVNIFEVGGLRHFDPVPFSLLNTLVAMEAIFLASFIVMRQSRLSRRSDEREHLMLQVLILAEKEITAVLNLQRKLGARAGISDPSTDAEIAQLSQTTSIDEVAKTVRESLPTE